MNKRLLVSVGFAAGFIFIVQFLFLQTNRISADEAVQTKAASKKPVPIQVPESTARAIEKDPKTAAKLIPGLANTPYLQRLIREQEGREICQKQNQEEDIQFQKEVGKESINSSVELLMQGKIWSEHKTFEYNSLNPIFIFDYYELYQRFTESPRIARLLNIANGIDNKQKVELKNALDLRINYFLDKPYSSDPYNDEIKNLSTNMMIFPILIEKLYPEENSLSLLVKMGLKKQQLDASLPIIPQSKAPFVTSIFTDMCGYMCGEILDKTLDYSTGKDFLQNNPQWREKYTKFRKTIYEKRLAMFKRNYEQYVSIGIMSSKSKKDSPTRAELIQFTNNVDDIDSTKIEPEINDAPYYLRILYIAQKFVD